MVHPGINWCRIWEYSTGIDPGFSSTCILPPWITASNVFQGFQELWEGWWRGPLWGPEQQQRQPHPRDPGGLGQPVPGAGAPAGRHLSAGAAQPLRCHSTAKPPLSSGAVHSRAVKPPIHSWTVKPPLHSWAVKPPLCSGAVKPPLCSGAVKPPLHPRAVKPPLHSRAVKPSLHSGAVKPPLHSRAVKPPVRFWAAQSPLCPLSS